MQKWPTYPRDSGKGGILPGEKGLITSYVKGKKKPEALSLRGGGVKRKKKRDRFCWVLA